MSANISLSIVVPVYRELETLPLVCEAFAACVPSSVTYEIVFVNDGNFNNPTHEMLQKLRQRSEVRVVNLARNYGQHVAIAAGLKNAQGDYCLVTDADLQYDSAECMELYWKATKENHSVVLSIVPNRADSFFKRTTAQLFYKLMSFLGTPVRRSDLGAVFVVNRHIAQGLSLMADRYRVTITMALWLSQNVAYVQMKHAPRKHGKSGYTLPKLVVHALNGVTSFSSKPLFLSLLFSMFFALAAIGWIIYLVVQIVVFDKYYLPGWSSLAILVLICSAVILGALGIMGIYLGRIFETVKGRPLYFVQDDNEAPAKLFEEA